MTGTSVIPDGCKLSRDRHPDVAGLLRKDATSPPPPPCGEGKGGGGPELREGVAERETSPFQSYPEPPPPPAPPRKGEGRSPPLSFRAPLASALRLPILVYRYSLSLFMGRRCRYLPTCSEFADEALARHGAWAGSWMAAARICRCNPWGGSGYDPVPPELPSQASWSRPWRYANRPQTPVCEAVKPAD